MRLVLLALLIVTMVGSASAMDYRARPDGTGLQANTYTPLAIGCNGINFDSALYQSDAAIYGNQLDAGDGGILQTLSFQHNGYGFAGPYNYKLSVWDFGTCTQLYPEADLIAADAAAAKVTEIVPLTSYGWAVTSYFFIGIQPLTCNAPGDCYPDVGFEYDYKTNPPSAIGCGSVVDLADPALPTCWQLSVTASDNVAYVIDYLMTVDLVAPAVTGACCVPGAVCAITTHAACTGQYIGDGTTCSPNPCVVPTEVTTWGAVKALYR